MRRVGSFLLLILESPGILFLWYVEAVVVTRCVPSQLSGEAWQPTCLFHAGVRNNGTVAKAFTRLSCHSTPYAPELLLAVLAVRCELRSLLA